MVNQRGFMGVTSMETAKLVDEYVCSNSSYHLLYLCTFISHNMNIDTSQMLIFLAHKVLYTSTHTSSLISQQLLQVLGQGFYGKVYLATSVNASTGEMVAVKQLDERKFQPEQFNLISAEFNALHRIINRNIVSYKQIILDENLIYVVTEFVDNGT